MNLQPHGSSGNIILSPSATQISQDWAARQPEHFASFLAGLSPSPHFKRPGSHKNWELALESNLDSEGLVLTRELNGETNTEA